MLTFTPSWSKKAFLVHNIYAHKREGRFLPEHSQDLSCNNPQEEPFQVMFLGLRQTREQKELNTRECEGQDVTKINVCLRKFMHPLSSVSDADSDDSADLDGENTHKRTIEEFTEEIDEARFVGHYNFFSY